MNQIFILKEISGLLFLKLITGLLKLPFRGGTFIYGDNKINT